MKTLLLAALAAAFAASPAAAAGVGLGQQYPRACASGYHPDREGNCQPNGGEQNRYCPAGAVYHPWTDGAWYCETPSGNVYY